MEGADRQRVEGTGYFTLQGNAFPLLFHKQVSDVHGGNLAGDSMRMNKVKRTAVLA
jgi:hypothetical protein